MPTGAQLRAARALLDWTSDELASKVGVSGVTIRNIENSRNKRPQNETAIAIERIFDQAGIEFLDSDGVRRRKEIEIFAGPDRFKEFAEYIYSELEHHGGDVCVYVTNERMFQKYRQNREAHTERMKHLVKEHGVTGRILTAESEFKETWAKIRRLPDSSHIGNLSFYIFANSYAVVLFDHDPAPYVIVHKIKAMADAYRQMFDLAWQKSAAK